MPTLNQFNEFALINRLTKNLKRHPDQVNKCHKSDAELVREPDGTFLAVTIDTLQEEYSLGLIRDPKTVGWSVVAHSLSDLAAVGAEPIGILLALNMPRSTEPEWGDQFFAGVQEALTAHCAFCLGGDTNFTPEPNFTCAAIGRVRHKKPLTRVGATVGDLLYITGDLGSGNLLGITRQVNLEAWEILEKEYRPVARLQEAIMLRNWMKCAIDTSDALLQAMAIIGELNQVGIHFNHKPELYTPKLVPLTDSIHFPLWLVNVFGMGEYELLFAVSPDKERNFLEDAARKGLKVQKIGYTKPEPGITISLDEKEYTIDVPYLLNLFGKCESIKEYIDRIVEYDRKLRSEK